jgi:hypothetical protein
MMVLMLFPVKWPKSIKAFGAILSWVSLDFINFVSPSCLGTPLNYYWRFMLLVIGTTVVIGVPWLFSYIRHKCWRRDPAKWEGAIKARFRDTYLLVMLFHPTVSGQAFYHFRCQHVGNETHGTSYLMVDYTIECYDATWYAMLVPVLSVIIFFSLGLPLVFAGVLYRRRHMLDDPATRRLWGILYSSFKPETYFYECLNMEFKVFLWAILVFFDRGSQFQMAFATMLCFIQLGLHARYEPYKEPVKNWLQYVGFAVVTTTAFGGLVLNSLELYKDIATLQDSKSKVREAQMQIDGFEGGLAFAMWAGIILIVTRVLFDIAKFLRKNQAKTMKFGRKLRRMCCRRCSCCGSSHTVAEASLEAEVELGEIKGSGTTAAATEGKGGDGEASAGIDVTDLQERERRARSTELGGGKWKDGGVDKINPFEEKGGDAVEEEDVEVGTRADVESKATLSHASAAIKKFLRRRNQSSGRGAEGLPVVCGDKEKESVNPVESASVGNTVGSRLNTYRSRTGSVASSRHSSRQMQTQPSVDGRAAAQPASGDVPAGEEEDGVKDSHKAGGGESKSDGVGHAMSRHGSITL